MAATQELIATYTASATTSITFSGIPQTYDDLLFRISGRNTGNEGHIYVTFNSINTGYGYKFAMGYGGLFIGSISAGYTNQAYMDFDASVNLNSMTASTFSATEIYIPQYRNSNIYRCAFATEAIISNGTNDGQNQISSGWVQQTAAITSISMATQVAPTVYNTGTKFYLYGIKNT
jgi:hypothetical protein